VKLSKGITGVLALAATAAFASALSAQTLQVLTAGSSAQFGPFAEAAWALATSGGATAYHYTVKSGACPTSTQNTTCYAYLNDSRSTSIAPEPGNLWVVWNSTGIWAYLSVDSTVGVRAFQAVPRATLALNLPATPQSAYNAYFDGKSDSTITTTVINALQGAALTAANTDIRPEDALFATNRSLSTLGYATTGNSLIGNAIQSAFGTSPAVAHPVSFSISSSGADPFSGTTPPAFVTIPIGAAPVVFLANAASGSVTANATNITTANAGILFSGTNCDSSMLGLTSGTAINPILREPLSGTMNTAQYSVFWPTYDQENNINDGNAAPGSTSNAGINPLQKKCTAGSGYRYRAVGTGDEVKAVQAAQTVTGGSAVTNAVGYSFFSYESTGTNASYKYLQLNGIDPLAYTGGSSYSTGALPSCSTSTTSGTYSCPMAGGASFINLRNGTYPAWSVYRLITDNNTRTGFTHTNAYYAQNLVTEAQALVNSTIPDFVPFNPVCSPTSTGSNDPGLDVYREHFVPTTITTVPNAISITADDGTPNTVNVSCSYNNPRAGYPHLTLGGTGEAGGDVGGAIEGPFTSVPPAGPVYATSPH
jgi:hypothetical protein